MIKICDKTKCCGCSACLQICPVNCISMKKDEEGFLYPDVEETKCVDCKLCEKVCPHLNEKTTHSNILQIPYAYGGWHKDKEILKMSSSGGAFSLFANYILDNNGSVYGCALDEDLKAIHIRVDNKSDLKKLCGSKYVQSDINEKYKTVWKDLKAGQKVLFTGTPCEVAGLNSYIQMKLKNCNDTTYVDAIWSSLYTCDFICHGVPSPAVFQSYTEYLKKKYGEEIKAFKFRMKDKKWNPSGLQLGTDIETEEGKHIRNFPAFRDAFMNGFLSDLYLRPSCHKCSFKYIPKDYSDITIADFWGVDKVEPSLNNENGTSLILLHNTHAKELFENVKDDFYHIQVEFEKAIRRNQSLLVSAKEHTYRKRFFQDYDRLPFGKIKRRYLKPTDWFFHKLLGLIFTKFENISKNILKKLFNNFNIALTEEKWITLKQFFKFCIVGISNVVVSYSINIMVLYLQKPLMFAYDYVVANIFAFALSVLWSFNWNSKYVFVDNKNECGLKKKKLIKMYMSYAFTGIFLNNILATFWIKILHISKYLAPLLNIPFTVIINFILNKFWAFNDGNN